MLVTAGLWSCSPDSVNPDGGETASAGTPNISLDGVAHPVVPGVCSDSASFELVDAGGGTDVNYCGPFPCDPNHPSAWGTALAYNTDSAIYIDVQLSYGWYLEMAEAFIGDESAMNIINGIPAPETGWIQQPVSPAVNAYQVKIPTHGLNLSDCESFCTIFSVVKLDFFGGADQASRRQLYLKNGMWNDPNNAWANTNSMMVAPYCGLQCGQPQCDPAPSYCDINFYCSNYEWIDNISLGTVDNTTGNNQGYGDFTSEMATLEAGQPATITMTPGYNGSCQYYERWVVFIDWNRDGDFFDSGELVTWGGGYGAVTRTFNVPANAETCELRMRVAMRWGCWPAGPCCSYYYGEAEDYTIWVNGAGNGRVAPREDDNVLQALNIDEKTAPGDVAMVQEGDELQVRSGSAQTLTVEVVDSKGAVVHTQNIKAKAGLNDLDLNFKGNELAGYTYRVKGGLERSADEMEMGSPAGME